MTLLHKFLTGAFTPQSEEEEQQVRRQAAKFTIVAVKLYKLGKASPMLRCLGKDETNLVLLEVHEGVCGSHIGRRVLAAKFLRAGYY